MTKSKAVQEWINRVCNDLDYDSKIITDFDGNYEVTSDDVLWMGGGLVYSFGSFVNSDANMEVDDIMGRF